MKRNLFAVATLALGMSFVVTGSATAHDHPAIAFSTPGTVGAGINAGGPGASWQLIRTFATGNPHTDLDFFTSTVAGNRETYMAAGTLATGPAPNSGGQTIFRLTQNGEVTSTSSQHIASHPSASCVSDPSAATGLQHDVEATPKGNVLLNTANPLADTRDAQLLLDATDNEGRCHDATTFGINPADPQGGLEIIDITNVVRPKEIGLTSHVGEAHTVNVDPKRPHIAFAVTSDFVAVTCNADDTSCTRANETDAASFALDGFEVVDLRSCMNFPQITPPEMEIQTKRMTCRPQVYRYRWPTALMALGHTVDAAAGCHELEIYPNDRLVCAAVNATMLFDMSGAFDNMGTPSNYLDDTPRGTPLPCRVRPSSTPAIPFGTGAMVTDCVVGSSGQDLRVKPWLETPGGPPSLEGVTFVGAAFHQGRPGDNTPPPYDSPVDVQISHEAELTGSGQFILTTDERGGGIVPPGAACLTSPADNPKGNGGIHAYRVANLLTESPAGVDPPLNPPPPPSPQAQQAWTSYAPSPTGPKAIHRVPINTVPQASVCTSHVFHQIPGQNRIFMGWYTQGTQVIDFRELSNGTVEFKQAGHFIPENANTWTSAVFKMQQNPNGTFSYWGATGDFNLAVDAAGRNAVDIYKVTLPAPAGPTAVTVTRFAATVVYRGVLLRWRTASESQILGFNVYRSRAGRLEKVNRSLVPARGGPAGAAYSVLDRGGLRGRGIYRLQAVERGGAKVWHGQVRLR